MALEYALSNIHSNTAVTHAKVNALKSNANDRKCETDNCLNHGIDSRKYLAMPLTEIFKLSQEKFAVMDVCHGTIYLLNAKIGKPAHMRIVIGYTIKHYILLTRMLPLTMRKMV